MYARILFLNLWQAAAQSAVWGQARQYVCEYVIVVAEVAARQSIRLECIE